MPRALLAVSPFGLRSGAHSNRRFRRDLHPVAQVRQG
jgi:hypothetical protein